MEEKINKSFRDMQNTESNIYAIGILKGKWRIRKKYLKSKSLQIPMEDVLHSNVHILGITFTDDIWHWVNTISSLIFLSLIYKTESTSLQYY